ncbi:MAG: tRNA 2-thiouridine(34) synthase MnmA [Rickettsiales bacterium]|nr:tRNA 2-thiouridine(34) synthase MnmA [Rickettsiales bacterium]
MKTVLVGMSGGVDSSVSAIKLLKEGYNVVGATLSMGRGCDISAIVDAKIVCEKLGIEHHVIDVSYNFKNKVIDYFVNSYLNGETPNPCSVCNRTVKFQEMINFMKKISADYIATGHYAKIIYNGNKYELHKADCLEKDQSYFLSTIKYEFLQYIKFPLAEEISKNNTREEAKNVGLHVFDKQDSQDVCFIDNNDYKKFLISVDDNICKEGEIKHLNGKILGRHNGIINYTIGQRKGLGVSYNKPIFVVKFDIKDNIVYVSDDENDLFNDIFYINNLNKLTEIKENYEYTVKIRSTHSGQLGKVELINENEAKIVLNEKTRAITKGQLCCLYDGSMVVGSGYIG